MENGNRCGLRLLYKDGVPPCCKITLLLTEYHTLFLAAFSAVHIKVQAVFAIPVLHRFFRLTFVSWLFLHHALVFAQVPFCKVHGNTSFQKRALKKPSI
jgi:hypothetical protein